ncbi:MAG: 2-isopropylmalate synthase [Desulfovibrionaceae bacterium]|nr:2-isopropylmalate synthase [Desulfovibrionaceae bacterium]
MSERIYIFDTTLRDGEQSPGATMNLAEKLRLARQLEILGVDIVEAGFPAASQGDFESVQAIAKAAGNIQITALCRAMPADIDRAWEAIKEARMPRLHTFLATSPLHMEYKLRKTPDQVVELAATAVRRAAGYTDNVEFSAEDASRSDKNFLCRVFAAVIDAGARVINIPDTVGYAQPEEYAELVRYVIRNTPGSHNVIFGVHCHNDLGLGVANTLAALKAGARQAEVTLLGLGERAGNAALEELIMSLNVRRDLFDFSHQIKSEQLFPACRLLSMIIGRPIPANKAIVGANAFAHESGIHQDGMLKHRGTYEIMTPESVGRSQSDLVLGKHSGRRAVKDKLEDMGYNLDDAQITTMAAAVKNLADKKANIYDEDLEALVLEEIYRLPDRFKLRHVSVQCTDTGVPPMAAVVMEIDGEERRHAGFGVGPVDALFNVIAHLTGYAPELQQYAVNAITGGTDAQGEVLVRLCQNSICAVGRGAHPDVIMASARAFTNALNRLAKKEREG